MAEPISRSAFLLTAIEDMQGTIRAVDAKLAVLFAVLLAPLGLLDRVVHVIRNLWMYAPVTSSIVLTIAFVALYLLAFLFALLGLVGLRNPVAQIIGEKPRGAFFAGGLFKFSPISSIFAGVVRSSLTVNEHLALIPTDGELLEKELAFEQMKLAFIRDAKLTRQKFAFLLAAGWLLCGVLLWVVESVLRP